MLTIITGAARSGKTAYVLQQLKENVNARRRCYFLVPEQYSHEAEREAARICGDQMSLCAEVLSFSRLARNVAQELGGAARVYVDKGGRLLQLAAALYKIGDQLKIYHTALQRAEQMEDLVQALEELRLGCIDAGALSAESRQAGNSDLADKLSDLGLLQQMLKIIEAGSAANPADKLDLLAETLPNSALLQNAEIYIDGFSDFTKQEKNVLEALLKTAANVTVCLTVDDEPGPGQRSAAWLQRKAKELQIEFVQKELQSQAAPLQVDLILTPEAESECALAAQQVQDLVQAGARYRDIAIAVRGYDRYAHLLEAAFQAKGIPLYLGGKTELLTRPLPAFIHYTYQALSDGWSYESMFTALKTGLLDLPADALDRLENYVLRWNLRGSQWTQKEDWAHHPRGFGEAWLETDTQDLELINATRRRLAQPLQKLAKALKAAENVAAQCQALANYWEDIRLSETLAKRCEELEQQGKQQLADEYRQLWELICEALEQAHALLGQEIMPWEVFGELFCRMLNQYSVATIPPTLDCVIAGDFDRMRRRNLKHLLVLSTQEGALPKIAEDRGIFSEEDRDTMVKLGAEISTEEDQLEKEYTLIENVLSLPSQSLWFSRPALYENEKTSPGYVTECLAKQYNLQEVSLEAPKPSSPKQKQTTFAGWKPDQAVTDLSDRHFSASKMDEFFNCRFKYFLHYGLDAKDREKSEFSSLELGTYLHYLVEKVGLEAKAKGGFQNFSDEEVAQAIEKYTEIYKAECIQDFESQSAKFRYLFSRTAENSARIVTEIAQELRQSDFQPLQMEMSFDNGALQGKVDRIDGWEHNGRLYLRVVDYKSGKKAFQLQDVCDGINLQMLLYLFSLQDTGYQGKPVVPAGVLYVPLRDPFVSVDTNDPEEIDQKRAKDLQRNGLLLNDPIVLEAMEKGDIPRYLPVTFKEGVPTGKALATAEQLGLLKKHVDACLGEMQKELQEGNVTIHPRYKSATDTACQYCPYAKICHFNQQDWHYASKAKDAEVWPLLEQKYTKEEQQP